MYKESVSNEPYKNIIKSLTLYNVVVGYRNIISVNGSDYQTF